MSSTPITLTTQMDDLKLQTLMNISAYAVFKITPEIHSHPYYEVLGAVEGEFRIEMLDGEAIMMRPGTLAIIPPDYPHSTDSDSDTHAMIVVRFSYDRVKGEPNMYDTFNSALAKLDGAVSFEDASHLTELMTNIRGELINNLPGANTMVHSLMNCLYIGILRQLNCEDDAYVRSHDFRDDNSSARYFIIDRWLFAHHAQNITEEDLARELNLSKRQMSRVLRDIYDKSFRELLIEVRLYRAVKLLTRSKCPVDEIASSVGYTTLSGFHRAFKKRFGITVGEYRKLHSLDNTKPNLY